VYDLLLHDYKEDYTQLYGRKGPWPLLVEARMSGVEISFTILVDQNGSFQILPTAMDYPERFEGPPGINNPITGGMGAISPHPLESPALLELAAQIIAQPLVDALKDRGLLRPCVLYPGCFLSCTDNFRPARLRVCEINIRPGEPEFQPVVKRLRNLGALVQAMVSGRLQEVQPEVRRDQISLCLALVTGPGGPKQQKGYPWSLTKGEPLEIDFDYFAKKNITIIPSAMDWDPETGFKSDGSRVAYLVANVTIKEGQKAGTAVETLRHRLLTAFDQGKIRVIPREDAGGNRLALRRDIGHHYKLAETLLTK
jgi:phosphoribosylamine--glycine ligase